MHELSIAMSLLDAAEEEAARLGVRVAAIRVRIGPLSGVVPAALLAAFELAREGSSLGEARLAIEEVPIVVRCPACAVERGGVSPQCLVCPVCGTPTPEIVRGRELEVVGLEVIDGDSDATGRSPTEGAQAE